MRIVSTLITDDKTKTNTKPTTFRAEHDFLRFTVCTRDSSHSWFETSIGNAIRTRQRNNFATRKHGKNGKNYAVLISSGWFRGDNE